MSNNDWKARLNVVYSTNPDYNFAQEPTQSPKNAQAGAQNLRVWLDRKQRAGRKVTLVRGFEGSEEQLKQLASLLKSRCGVGGGAKDGEIMIQGDFCDRVVDILVELGYTKTKRAGS